MSTLKEILRNRLLDMVRSVKPAGNPWKIVVVDPISVKILSAACKMFDILEENVTVVETITKRRQPYPTFEAVYFLSPTVESVNRLIEDFTTGQPGGKAGAMYAAAHLFFTEGLEDPLFNKLTASGAKRYIKTLKELFVDFIAIESQVFSLQMSNNLYYLFSPDVPMQDFNGELERIAKHLVSVCATLGEYPAIRYHRPDTPSTTARSNIAGRLAAVFQNEMDAFCRLDPNFPPQQPTPIPRATMIILDRTMDVQAPLLHEFTYQAMANDLLPLTDNGSKYTYAFVGGNGEETVKDVVLDEDDPLWIQVRHTHIAECINTLIQSFNQFTTENKAAQRAGGGRQVASLNDMKEMLAAIPQFQDLKSKFSVHISMAQECMNLFEKHRIAATAAVEQDMATGEIADGSGPSKNIVADMVPLLDDPSISSYDKVRLLSLYIISKEGVQDDDRRKLLDHARISSSESSAITNLSLLGVRLSKAPKTGRNKEKKKEKKPKKARADDVPYELSRYVPALKTVLEDCAAGTLDTNLFPFTRELQPEMDSSGVGGVAPKKQPVSLRSTKPTWAKKGTDKAEPPPKSGGRLIVFMAGGITFAEVRSCYELAKAVNRDVICGSTHILTPSSFIDELKTMRTGGMPSGAGGPMGGTFPGSPQGSGASGQSYTPSGAGAGPGGPGIVAGAGPGGPGIGAVAGPGGPGIGAPPRGGMFGRRK